MVYTREQWAELSYEQRGSCIEWQGTRDVKGYGVYSNKRYGTQRAHRVAWIQAHGQIPDGLHVLHHCDNPPCNRIDHLFVGTNAENNADMWAKGRGVLPPLQRKPIDPARAPKARLTWAKVREIRSRGDEDKYALAAEYGVTYCTIWDVLTGRTWKE